MRVWTLKNSQICDCRSLLQESIILIAVVANALPEPLLGLEIFTLGLEIFTLDYINSKTWVDVKREGFS